MQNQLRLYSQSLNKDLPAGLVVFLVALPLCLGISLASGAPLFAGVITGIVGGLVVSWCSGSALSVSGPAAGLTVIVLDGIRTLQSYETFLLAGLLAGAVQLVLGFCKAGVIGLYVPSSVIRGMLAAIGLTLILKQIPHFMGLDKEPITEEPLVTHGGHNPIAAALQNFTEAPHMGSLLVGLVSMAILILWETKAMKRMPFTKVVPGALIAVVLSVFANSIFSAVAPSLIIAPSHLVNLPVFASLGQITSEFRHPNFAEIGNSAVWVVAFTIAIIASLETLLSIEAVDKIDSHRRITPPNRELKAQGFGNIIAASIGGIPMTAVIVRSSANVDAGGQTRISSAFHGLLLLLSVLFLARYINLVPLSALSAVLLVVGYKLTKPSLVKAQFKLGWEQFVPFVVTIIAVLMTDLLIGVGMGLLIAVFFILKANYESSHYLHEEILPEKRLVRVELSENVSFLNKASIMRVLDEIPEGNHVIIDGSKSTFIDYDVLEAIQNFKTSAADKDIDVELVKVPEVSTISH